MQLWQYYMTKFIALEPECARRGERANTTIIATCRFVCVNVICMFKHFFVSDKSPKHTCDWTVDSKITVVRPK